MERIENEMEGVCVLDNKRAIFFVCFLLAQEARGEEIITFLEVQVCVT